VCLGKHKRQDRCPGQPRSHQAWIGEVEGQEDGTMAVVMDYVGRARTVKSPRSIERRSGRDEMRLGIRYAVRLFVRYGESASVDEL
jgi:hypothetical protein